MAIASGSSVLHEVQSAPLSTPELGSVNHDAKKIRFERLVAEHYAFVWRTSRRLGVRSADLDDAVQEVFLVAARNLDAIEEERGYLLRACIFVASHARRALRRRREIVDGERIEEEVDRRARPDETAEATEARERCQRILDRMPEELSTVFVLYELERFTTTEIAEAMSLPQGTVASRLRRARKQFMTLAARNRSEGLR
jgi:RNA polymerase sigma-70 factor, ECF subfamily